MLGLPALGLTYVATHSVPLQFAVAFALVLVAQPMAARRFGKAVDPAAVRELAKRGPMYAFFAAAFRGGTMAIFGIVLVAFARLECQ